MKLILLAVLFGAAAYGQTPAPACPAGVAHCVELTWDYSNAPLSAFNIYRTNGTCAAAPAPPWTLLSSGNIGILTFQDNNVTAGATYCWYVTATQGGVESGPSNFNQNTIPTGAAAAPPAPTNLASATQ